MIYHLASYNNSLTSFSGMKLAGHVLPRDLRGTAGEQLGSGRYNSRLAPSLRLPQERGRRPKTRRREAARRGLPEGARALILVAGAGVPVFRRDSCMGNQVEESLI